MILKTYFINFYGIVRKEKIKRSVIINEYEEGGLKMSHIQFFYKAFKMSWLHKLLDPFNHSPWKLLLPASPAYGVYISQLIRYARASSNYSDFLKRHLHLRNRLLDQGYKHIHLIRSLKKFIFRYQDLVEIYSVSAETIINDAFSYSENV
jgi:hypothetical protein